MGIVKNENSNDSYFKTFFRIEKTTRQSLKYKKKAEKYIIKVIKIISTKYLKEWRFEISFTTFFCIINTLYN